MVAEQLKPHRLSFGAKLAQEPSQDVEAFRFGDPRFQIKPNVIVQHVRGNGLGDSGGVVSPVCGGR